MNSDSAGTRRHYRWVKLHSRGRLCHTILAGQNYTAGGGWATRFSLGKTAQPGAAVPHDSRWAKLHSRGAAGPHDSRWGKTAQPGGGCATRFSLGKTAQPGAAVPHDSRRYLAYFSLIL